MVHRHGELPSLRTAAADAAARGAAGLAATAEMAAKLQSDDGKAACRRRKWIAEPPNGWIKNVLGFRQFSMRGLHRVRAEWKLVCLVPNLRRMAVLSASRAAVARLSD